MNKSKGILFIFVIVLAAINFLMFIIEKDATKAEHYHTRFNIYIAAMYIILANS